jgi:hypothetical protein
MKGQSSLREVPRLRTRAPLTLVNAIDQEVGEGVELLHPIMRGGVTKGWRLKNVTESLQEERKVKDVLFSERARLFRSFGVERLDEMLRCRELPGSHADIIELFMGDLLDLSRQCINDKII